VYRSLRSKSRALLAAHFKSRVLAHKGLLSEAASRYSAYQNVAFVFQVFNKAKNCDKILTPFLKKGCSNVIVFADGCIDGSALVWHNRLIGKNHLVVSANDLHEIRNYRLSIEIANHWNCSHVVLLQDDDVYDERLFDWLDSALKASSQYGAAIIGGNGGSDLDCSFSYQRADSGLLSAEFVMGSPSHSKSFYSLGCYQRMLLPSGFVAANGMMPHKFVANVNRAPQLINVKSARQLSFFPKELEPYQYDDYYNCFKSWLNGHPVVLMPFGKVASDVGIGGMRLYNDVNVRSRPLHFVENWNFVLDRFSDSFTKIDELVSDSNRRWLT
jgi:hypothetical protein